MRARKIIAIVALSLVVAAATAWTWKLHGYPKVGIDDANIFFTYAENLASGNGITYGQNGEAVEGVTSILWMLLCTVMFALGADETGVFVLCFVLFVLTQVLFFKATNGSSTQSDRYIRASQAIYLALILSSPAYITWMTITLMDTCLWGVIIGGMTFSMVFPPRSKFSALIASVPYLVAPLARPEAFLVVPVFILLLRWRSTTSFGKRLCIFLTLSFLMVAVGVTVFRMQYFGYPLPNTYYAKVSPLLGYNLKIGMEYLYEFILSSSVVGVSCLLVLIRCALWSGQLMDRIRLRSFRPLFKTPVSAGVAVSLGALTLLTLPVLTGGDHFGMFRFFQPAIPLIFLSAILSVKELSACALERPFISLQWLKTNIFKGVMVLAVIIYWFFEYSSAHSWSSIHKGSPIEHQFRIAEKGMAIGERLNEIFAATKPLPSVGVVIAGGIARTYRGPIIDMMGLNNSLIAHSEGDRTGVKNHAALELEVFFRVEPDILVGSPPVPLNPRHTYGDVLKGLLKDPRFTGQWRCGTLSLRKNSDCSQRVLIRKAFLEEIADHDILEFSDTMIWRNRWVKVH